MKKYILDAISSVKDYIDKHPLSTKTITELANDAGIGRNTLQKAFKFEFHHRIREYQLHNRMELARTLLQETKLSKKEVARRSGYRSQNSFSKYFKKVSGMSPTAWQKKHKRPRTRRDSKQDNGNK